MKEKSILTCQSEILKGLGHKSRTLLSGITGPIQIIRSLSDEPKLIEPLRILELSVSRFERFSLRSLMLSNLLQNKDGINLKPITLVETFRYVVLDFTDLLDFFNVNIEISNSSKQLVVNSDHDLLSQCVMVILEQIISMSSEGTKVKVDFVQKPESVYCEIYCSDNGSVFNSLSTVLSADSFSSDIDLQLLKHGFEALKAQLSMVVTSEKYTKITIELPQPTSNE